MTTWNPSDKDAAVTLAFGNTVAYNSSGTAGAVRSTTSKSSGKYYFEVNITNLSSLIIVGVANASDSISTAPGVSGQGSIGYVVSGAVIQNGRTVGAGNSFTTGDVVGVALDVSGLVVYFAANNVWLSGQNPATNTGGIPLAESGPFFIDAYLDNSDAVTQNFGPGFTYTAPSGFTAWDLSATNVNLTGVSATGSVGTIAVNSPDRAIVLVGAAATASAGTISKTISPNVAITGVGATASAGSILFGQVAGALVASEAPDVVSISGNIEIAGALNASEDPDIVSVRVHYGFVGWIPATIQSEVWTEI